MRLLQVPGERLEQVLAFQSRLAPEILGTRLELREVVHVSLDEIGDLFGGEAGDLDPFELLPLGQALGQGLRRGARRLVGVVQAEQRAGDQRRVADHLAHVGGRQPVSVEDRIAEDLEQVGHETFVLPAPKRLQIELELLGQPDEHLGAESAAVVLDEVEVAGGNPEPLRHPGLAQPFPTTQGPDPGPQLRNLLDHLFAPSGGASPVTPVQY